MKKKVMTPEDAEKEIGVWLGDAQQNLEDAVEGFAKQWQPWPKFDIGIELMDVRQLRDAIGVRASGDYGDPWPSVERLLLDKGFRWRSIGSQRVMFVKERDDFMPDDGWNDGELID